jgi:hypothetical protein
MVPVLVLAIIAVALIKSLMSVVAREEGTALPPWSPDAPSTTAADLTVELHATVNDDVRAFLLPAAPDPADAEQPEPERTGITERTR